MNENSTGAAASQPSPGDLKALRIIADTHSALLQSNDLGEIYQLVGQKIYELVGDGYVVMSQMEESTQSMRVVAQFGLGNLAQKAIQILGQDPRQSVFYLKDRTEEELKSFRSGKLERMEGGLYAMLARRLPKAACTAVEKLLGVKGVYAMGLVWHGLHFGDLTLMAKRDIAPYREMIEIIMNQAALTVDRLRAEEKLRQSEEDFRNLFERAPVGFYRTTPDGQILMANPALIQMLGAHSFQELASRNLEMGELVPVEQRTEFKRLVETEGEVTGLEGIWLKADGTPIRVRESARAVCDAAGKTLYYEGTAEDITERVRAQTSLQESERRFREALENVHLVALNLDKEGRVTFCNDYFLQRTGFGRNDVLEQDFFAFCIPAELQVELRAIFQAALEGEELPIHHNHEILARTGERLLVAWTNTLMRDSDGRPVGINYLGEDITEQRLLEQKAEKARMDFVYAVSHELKTPLFLMATAQEMLKSLPEQARLKRFEEQEELWTRNLLRLRLLINNLVDSQRTQTTGMRLNFVPSDLAALAQQALTDLQILAAKKNQSLVADLANLPLLPLDPDAIERVLHNLLTNAIKFSPPRGEVTVRLKQEENRAVLIVQDHGVGIPADVLPDLFQPFRRAPGAVRSVVPGTGLGLYVTKILVEAHGGTVSLESEVSRGTTVTVQLPLPPSTQSPN